MTPRRTALVLAAASLLSWGCGPSPAAETVNARTDPVSWPSPPEAFEPSADCTPLGNYKGPTPGFTYIYRRQDSSLSSRTIVSTDGTRITFQYRDLSNPSQIALPNRMALAGVFVTYDAASSPRKVRYRTDPVATLETLEAGRSATIPTTETSTIRGKTRAVTYPTVTTYRVCGVLNVQGRRAPVRVYDVTTSRRVVDPSGDDAVRSSQVTYYLSNETGFPMAYQDAATTTLERIEGPGTAL